MSEPAKSPSPAPAFVDLHMHSTASDGAVPAAEVVAAAARAGLAAIALTDHDTVAGVSEASRAAEQLHHLRVVPGVELSAHEGSAEVHLLGLHLARLGEMERDLAQFRAARHARAERIVGRLNALGVPVTMDAVIAEAAGGAIGRPHVARALVAGGWARDFRDAFDRYLGMGRPAHVAKEHFALGDAIALVHRAGGLAILAHPGASATRERLERFLAIGLDGVEVRHPSHPPAEVQRIGRLAAQLGLVPSGGSDWHGALEGTRTIGVMQVPAEWLSEQDARVRERARRANVA